MEPDLAKAWPEKQAGLKDFCERLLAAASKHDGVEWESVAREGISHSFRAVKPPSGRGPLAAGRSGPPKRTHP